MVHARGRESTPGMIYSKQASVTCMLLVAGLRAQATILDWIYVEWHCRGHKTKQDAVRWNALRLLIVTGSTFSESSE